MFRETREALAYYTVSQTATPMFFTAKLLVILAKRDVDSGYSHGLAFCNILPLTLRHRPYGLRWCPDSFYYTLLYTTAGGYRRLYCCGRSTAQTSVVAYYVGPSRNSLVYINHVHARVTRNSAAADKPRDAFVCKYNSMTDLRKTRPSPYVLYHAEFGISALKGVGRIYKGKPK